MSAATQPDRADLIAHFGRDAYYHIIHTLSRGLPEPPTNDPDAIRRRDHAVIARIAALCPANVAEADTASLYVAASEQWKECLRLAQLPETPLKQAMQCRNQANAMMRQAQGALRLFLRMQAVREKREATHQSCDRAAFTEQWNTDLMAEALAAQPSPAATAEPPAAAPEPSTEPEPCPAPLAAADARLVRHPHPPAPSRRTPRIPDGIPFAPAANGIALIAANGAGAVTRDHRGADPGA